MSDSGDQEQDRQRELDSEYEHHHGEKPNPTVEEMMAWIKNKIAICDLAIKEAMGQEFTGIFTDYQAILLGVQDVLMIEGVNIGDGSDDLAQVWNEAVQLVRDSIAQRIKGVI